MRDLSLNTAKLFETRVECRRCRLMLPASDFYNGKAGSHSNYWCKGCWSEFNATPERTARRSDLRRARNRALRLEVLNHYSHGTFACACCGVNHHEFLALDHVDGGGRVHRKKTGSSVTYWLWFIRSGFPTWFRVLCHNCNMARGMYGQCPHEKTALAAVG